MCAEGGCQGDGPGQNGRCHLFDEQRSWVLVPDFNHVAGEVAAGVYYSGSGCPVARRAYFRQSPPPFSGGLCSPGQLCSRLIGKGSGIGGKPWSSAEALSRSPHVLLLALPLPKVLVPLADDSGVPSSHPFLKAPSMVRGSKVGTLLLDWGRLVVASYASIYFFYHHSLSCGNILQLAFGCVIGGEVTGALRLWFVLRSLMPGMLGWHWPCCSRVSCLPSGGTAPFEPGREDCGPLRR